MKRLILSALLGGLVSAAPASALVAVYEVSFDATWSQATHPVDFPPNPHFSGLVGGTHDETLTFWEEGGLASPGIEAMAERGVWSTVADEVAAAGGTELLGVAVQVSPGIASFQFEIDSETPLVTLVSMLAPSPDWFVGVNGLSLWEGGWLHRVEVPLVPYDAGTDSGTNYLSFDSDTQPPEPIAELTGFPFTGTGPVGSLTFSLVPGCNDGIDNDADGLIDFDGAGVGAPDPRCIGAPNRLLEHGGGCGLLGIEPFLLLAPCLLFRRRIA